MNTRELFYQYVAQTSPAPLALEIERAEGSYFYDISGKSYLDFISGIAVSNVGHRHPKVIEAIEQQLQKYLHIMVYGEMVQTPQVQLAEALAQTLANYTAATGKLQSVYFTNSGTEAVEGAMKLAKRFTGRTGMVSCTLAYHGSTQGALSLGDETFKRSYRPLLPDVHKIIREDFESLSVIGPSTAGVIIEPIGGEAGVRPTSQAFLEAIAQRCREVGALLIFDEIQSGFGRTGTFWAFEPFGVVPDIVLCAKGMGGGLPIGAFIAPTNVMAVLQENPVLGHITTFGGHPLSCAASLATLKVIDTPDFLSNVRQKADYLGEKLRQMPQPLAVRQAGLMAALQLRDFETVLATMHACIANGLLTDWFLYCDNSLRIAPPLTISYDEIDEGCSKIQQSLNEVYSK